MSYICDWHEEPRCDGEQLAPVQLTYSRPSSKVARSREGRRSDVAAISTSTAS